MPRLPAPDDGTLLLTVSGLEGSARLDRYLRDRFSHWGRQETGTLITAGKVTVNGRQVVLGSWQVRNGDTLTVADPPPDAPDGPDAFDPAWLLADDGVLLAVNKPSGLLTEPTRWGTGANMHALAEAWLGERLHLPHRLDRDTSGVLLMARPGDVKRWLDAQFRQRTVSKHYVAVVALPNRLEAEGLIDAPLAPDPQRDDRMRVVHSGGQWARTRYRTRLPSADGKRQLVDLWPESGRTHQLRVHLLHMGAPILGDRIYGIRASAPRLMLHALALGIPAREDAPACTFTAPLPPEFLAAV